jgi:choline dehydrogenase
MSRSYDYIIVGAGSAGAVVASRLSEDKDVSVLLLESGGRDQHRFQLMPLAFQKVVQTASFNWNYETEPEPGLANRRLQVPRGRVLGGTSSINAMICMRGNPEDYDLWAKEGLEGWSYADVLPYFKRLETHWRGETAYHGGGGPIRVTPMDYPYMLYEPLRQAAMAFGIPLNDDVNGPRQEGFSLNEATVGDGRRSSTARAYLYPAMQRPNLTVETRALVSRILIENGRAMGVEYRREGDTESVFANREIVLSGGTYNSPQILMLSGIGPAQELQTHGITPVHDLPGLGRNLSEHSNFIGMFRLRQKDGITRYLRLDRAIVEVARWFMRHDGPFASNGATANLFMRSGPDVERPDLQLTFMPVDNFARLWCPAVTAAPIWCYSVRIGVLHAKSRGWVRLRSADPADKPRIQLNLFTDHHDVETMIAGIRLCREFFRQPPLHAIVEEELSPGAASSSDADLETAIRQAGGHRSHPVGTCRMGRGPDAVVDPELRVRGIDGLRVIDASVMPETPSGNTNVPSIMIGEKGADLLRGRRLAAETAKPTDDAIALSRSTCLSHRPGS